jgi:hypothetical protein
MQYLEINKAPINASKIPLIILFKAMALIESTKIEMDSGKKVTTSLDGNYLNISGEGVVSEIDPLINGLNMIKPYLDLGSSINIDTDDDNWETRVHFRSSVH